MSKEFADAWGEGGDEVKARESFSDDSWDERGDPKQVVMDFNGTFDPFGWDSTTEAQEVAKPSKKKEVKSKLTKPSNKTLSADTIDDLATKAIKYADKPLPKGVKRVIRPTKSLPKDEREIVGFLMTNIHKIYVPLLMISTHYVSKRAEKRDWNIRNGCVAGSGVNSEYIKDDPEWVQDTIMIVNVLHSADSNSWKLAYKIQSKSTSSSERIQPKSGKPAEPKYDPYQRQPHSDYPRGSYERSYERTSERSFRGTSEKSSGRTSERSFGRTSERSYESGRFYQEPYSSSRGKSINGSTPSTSGSNKRDWRSK
jgi:hypothetical protein